MKDNSCQHCTTQLTSLPFYCRHCKKYFCTDCRLPENHNCKQFQTKMLKKQKLWIKKVKQVLRSKQTKYTKFKKFVSKLLLGEKNDN